MSTATGQEQCCFAGKVTVCLTSYADNVLRLLMWFFYVYELNRREMTLDVETCLFLCLRFSGKWAILYI